MTENDRKIATMMSFCPHEYLLPFCIKHLPKVEDNAVYFKSLGEKQTTQREIEA